MSAALFTIIEVKLAATSSFIIAHSAKARARPLAAETSVEDLVFIKELIEAGKVVPVIDRRYPLSEVAEALLYYGERHSQGKVVITVEH